MLGPRGVTSLVGQVLPQPSAAEGGRRAHLNSPCLHLFLLYYEVIIKMQLPLRICSRGIEKNILSHIPARPRLA